MNRLLLSLLLVLYPLVEVRTARAQSGQMLMVAQKIAAASTPLSVVQAAASIGLLSSETVTLGSNATTGNRLIVGIAVYNVISSITSVQDNNGNNFTQDNFVSTLGGSLRDGYFYSLKVTASTTSSVTVTLGGVQYFGAVVYEVAGIPGAGTITDGKDTVGGAVANPFVTGNVVTTFANDIVVGVAFDTNTATSCGQGTGWSTPSGAFIGSVPTGTSVNMVYKIVAATSTYNPTGNGGESCASLGMSYKGN